MTTHFAAGTTGGLWRRAVQALAHAFDPAREGADADSVFQTRGAPAQSASDAFPFEIGRDGEDAPPRPRRSHRRDEE